MFLVVGLQLRDDRGRARHPVGRGGRRSPRPCCWWSVVGRFVWVFPATYVPRWIPRVRRREPDAAVVDPGRHRLGRHAGRGDAGHRAGAPADAGRRQAVPAGAVRLAGLRGDRDHAGAAGHDPAGGGPAAAATRRRPGPGQPGRGADAEPGQSGRPGPPGRAGRRRARRSGRAAAPAHRGPHATPCGSGSAGRPRPRRGPTSGCAGRCSRPSGRCSGWRATRGASRRRCWSGPSARWTWKSRYLERSED